MRQSGKLRIGALISGGGTNLQAVIDACESGNIDGRLVFVGSDAPGAKGLERADRHGIPRWVVDYRAIIAAYRSDPRSVPVPPGADPQQIAARCGLFGDGSDPDRNQAFIRTRLAAEHEMLQKIEGSAADLIILAGFMRNLTPYFIDRINTDPERPRIMNIHPALLPAFPGTDGYGDTYRYGCKIGGCTVHFVDYGEDTGPIVGQRAFAISETDTLESIRAKGLAEEWRLYPACIQLFAENRLRVIRPDGPADAGKPIPPRPIVRCLPP